jgi:protein-L-isoaspartate(D-aspartate) O-methyltransferase
MNLNQARNNMIEQQVRPWDVLDQRVLDVLAVVPREDFVASEHRGLAFSDFQLPIGHGQTLFKPTIDGRLLQALALEVTDTVLEVGTGSGYLTACLARLTHHCDSVEIVAELANSAAERLQNLGVSNVTLSEQDGSQLKDVQDRYNAIAFGGAIEAVPAFYRDRMAVDGRLFAIIGDTAHPTMEAILLTRISESEWSTESLFETSVDPLVNFSVAKPSFIF